MWWIGVAPHNRQTSESSLPALPSLHALMSASDLTRSSTSNCKATAIWRDTVGLSFIDLLTGTPSWRQQAHTPRALVDTIRTNSCTKLNGKERGSISQGPHALATVQKAWHLSIRKGTGHQTTRCTCFLLIEPSSTLATWGSLEGLTKRAGLPWLQRHPCLEAPWILASEVKNLFNTFSLNKLKGRGTAWWFALGGLAGYFLSIIFTLVTLWFQPGGKAQQHLIHQALDTCLGGLPQSTITSLVFK